MQFFFLLLLFVSSFANQLAPPITPKTSMQEYVAALNITLEKHYVTTTDGYILLVHRLPNPGRPVVFLQHGILASSWCWIANDPSRALGIVLHRAGYDVWLGNNRGNAFSMNHTSLPIRSKAFWNFTFNEMALFDLPAMIDTTLNITGKKNLNLIAWSQGNTQTFIASSDSHIGKKLSQQINLWIALSPVTYLYDSSSTLLTLVSRLHLADVLEAAFPYGVLQGGPALSALETFLCEITFGELCKLSVDLICGVSKDDTVTGLERLTAHFPAGCSVKDVSHYEQFIDQPVFAKFDYGKEGNEKEYNETIAPNYNITNSQIKLALFAGGQDDLVNSKDLQRMTKEFPPKMIVANNLYDGFSHVTWMVGSEAAFDKWGNDVLELLIRFEL